jgi:preprotein translocase subunit SecY
MRWLKDIASTLTPGQPIYVMLYAAAIIFFCFFYTGWCSTAARRPTT